MCTYEPTHTGAGLQSRLCTCILTYTHMTSHTHVCTQPDTDTDIATDTFTDILRHKHTHKPLHTQTQTHIHNQMDMTLVCSTFPKHMALLKANKLTGTGMMHHVSRIHVKSMLSNQAHNHHVHFQVEAKIFSSSNCCFMHGGMVIKRCEKINRLREIVQGVVRDMNRYGYRKTQTFE